MKITFFEVEAWQKKYLREKLKKHELRFVDGELTMKNVSRAKGSEGIGVFIYSEVTKEVLDKLPGLKFVVTFSTGFNHIDTRECKKRGIRVSNVPRYGENTVAEHAVGLMLSLSKNIPEGINRVKKGSFDLEGLEGFDLKGKTLGVIGSGNIGQHVIKIAKAMEMEVVVYNRSRDSKLARKLGFKYVSLNKLLSVSDMISLHVPLFANTKHMINMKNVRGMKKGCYIINTARGGLIETKALVYGLDKGIIAGAALDVLEGEDDLMEDRPRHLSLKEKKVLRQNHLLLKDKEVLVTPHSAFYTREALMRILDVSVLNVVSRGKRNSVIE